jgi:hypothetical protein
MKANFSPDTLSPTFHDITWVFNASTTSIAIPTVDYAAAAVTLLYQATATSTASLEKGYNTTTRPQATVTSTASLEKGYNTTTRPLATASKTATIGIEGGIGLILLLVGIGIVLALFLVGIPVIWRKYTSKKKMEDSQSQWGKPELDGDAIAKSKYVGEMSADSMHELEHVNRVGELEGTELRELEDTGQVVEIRRDIVNDSTLEHSVAQRRPSSENAITKTAK